MEPQVQVVKRGDTSGEKEPLIDGPILATSNHRVQFDQAASMAMSYQELLKQGIQIPSPGAPVPVMYPGGPLLDPRPGVTPPGDPLGGAGPVPNPSVVSGIHKDPSAGEYNDGVTGKSGDRVLQQGADPFAFSKPGYPVGPTAGGLRNGRI